MCNPETSSTSRLPAASKSGEESQSPLSTTLLRISSTVPRSIATPLVCSDDPDAAQLNRELAAKIPGVRALEGGKLENAHIVEQITALLIGLNIRHKGRAGIRITELPP